MAKFAEDVAALIYTFLDTMFDEAKTRNIVACLGLAEPAHGERRSMLLETDFRGLLDDGISGRGVLRVKTMRDIGDPFLETDPDAVNDVDAVWMRHVMAHERTEGSAFHKELTNIINEWVWRSDNWRSEPLRSARLEIKRPMSASTALFACMHHVVENHVYASPWIFMTDLMTKVHAFNTMRQFEAAVATALVSTNVRVLTPDVADEVLLDLKQPLVFGMYMQSMEPRPPPLVRTGALGDESSPEPGGLLDVLTVEEELQEHLDMAYLFPGDLIDPSIELTDRSLDSVTPPHMRALFRTALANKKDASAKRHAE
jgi:hypothetical protein